MFDFSEALSHLKKGKHVARAGWNGKGMWVHLMDNEPLVVPLPNGSKLHTGLQRFFVISTVAKRINTWVPSVSDLLAEDWVIVDETN